MKLENAIVIVKGGCLMGATTLLALSSGLGQWSNSTATPSFIQWTMILGGSFGAGLTALYGFLSNSFGNFVKGMDASGNPPSTTTTVTTSPPVAAPTPVPSIPQPSTMIP